MEALVMRLMRMMSGVQGIYPKSDQAALYFIFILVLRKQIIVLNFYGTIEIRLQYFRSVFVLNQWITIKFR